MSQQSHPNLRSITRSGKLMAVSALGLLGFASAQATGAAISLPFSDNFDSETTSTVQNTWTETQIYTGSTVSPGTDWTVGTTGAVSGKGFNDTYTDAGSVSQTDTASLYTGATGPRNFTISSDFILNSFSGTDTRIGFGALNSVSNLNYSPGTGYLADFSIISNDSVNNPTGSVRIASSTDPGFTGGQTATGIAVTLGDEYVETLTGTYVGPTLDLSYTVQDLTANGHPSVTETATDTNPLTGGYFGYRDGNEGPTNVTYDNFSFTPEPSSLAMLGLGSLGMLGRRRRNVC